MISLHGRKVVNRDGTQKRDCCTRYRPLLTGVELTTKTDDEKLELLSDVRANNKEAIEVMILSHIRLATSIVNRYIGVYNFGFYANDLDSAAMMGIVEAVNKVAKGSMSGHDNITGYIVKFIHSRIIDAMNRSSVVRVPRTSKKKTVETLSNIHQPILKTQLDVEELEIWDSIANLAGSRLERRILELKSKGYVDREIGEILDLPRYQVCRLRNKLFERYKRKEV